MKKILKTLAAMSLVGFATVLATSCNGTTTTTTSGSNQTTAPDTTSTGGSNTTTSGPTTSVEGVKTYKVKAECINGKPVKEAEIVIKGKGVEETAYTDKNGYATFELKEQTYTVYPESLPGYTIDDDYQSSMFDGSETELVVKYNPSLINEPKPVEYIYTQGDVMYETTFTGVDFSTGTAQNDVSKTLSSLLEQNDVVLLNFWYTTCSWCNTEFPSLISAYSQYKDKKVALIGVNPTDGANDIISYGANMGFNFLSTISGDASAELVQAFNITGFPSTIIIDRYGLIGQIHSGAITSEETWKGLFDEYLADDYEPKYIPSNEMGNQEFVSPDPAFKFPGSEALANAALASGVTGEFVDGYDQEYDKSWPWIVSEDGKSIHPSNQKVDFSYSYLRLNVTVPAKKVIAFDYVSSCETNDILGIYLESKLITKISGAKSDTIYLYAAGDLNEDITINFMYLKDTALSQFDDTVYIKNVRFMDVRDVPVTMRVIRQASYGTIDKLENVWTNYINPVYNEADGYYHVNSVDGPLLMADLLSGNTHFSETPILGYAYSEETDFFEDKLDRVIEKYAQYANNSVFNIMLDVPTEGLTPVTQELYDALIEVVKLIGSGTDKNKEVLEICVYIDEYLKNGDAPIGDPIAGLAKFNAFEAKEGLNHVEYKYPFVPRGYYFKFTPTKTGVYLIDSTQDESDAMLFIDSERGLVENEAFTRDYFYKLSIGDTKSDPIYEYLYCEAGKDYYFAPTFWSSEEFGVLDFEITYVAEKADHLAAASTSVFTSSDENMEDIISRSNVNVQLGTDGYYHPVDKSGNIITDEYIYLDVEYITGIFPDYSIKEMIDKGAFDFTKTELGEAAEGEDMTEQMRAYIATAETDTNSIYYGTVKVDQALQGILQKLLDKYTFPGVEGSWLKVCYFVVHLGA